MGRALNFSIGEYYHIYSRGVDKRTIFQEAGDYRRFVLLLYLCNSNFAVDLGNILTEGPTFREVLNLDRISNITAIGAYTLMPNHIHILVKETIEGGISKFMKKMLTGYSMYFNKKYKRSGSLFESRFKAVCADRDEYLKYLFVYLHLNPVKLIDKDWKERGIKNLPESERYLNEYEYSSYLDYIGSNRPEKNLLNISSFPEYFSTCKDFVNFHKDWLLYKTFEF